MQACRFMDAYTKGLDGKQAAWATKKYHGHRVLPDSTQGSHHIDYFIHELDLVLLLLVRFCEIVAINVTRKSHHMIMSNVNAAYLTG